MMPPQADGYDFSRRENQEDNEGEEKAENALVPDCR